MEAIAFVLGLVAIGALAVRFGQDSRDGFRSAEHTLAGLGLTWADRTADRGASVATAAASAAQDPPSVATAPGTPSYPTLLFIERAIAATGTLTDAPDAARRELRARELAAEYWSDLAWTTGVVPEAALRQVLAELAPALAHVPVIAVERPIAAAAPVALAQPAIGPERQPAARERTASLSLAGSSASA